MGVLELQVEFFLLKAKIYVLPLLFTFPSYNQKQGECVKPGHLANGFADSLAKPGEILRFNGYNYVGGGVVGNGYTCGSLLCEYSSYINIYINRYP